MMHYNNLEKLTFYKPIVNNNYQELKIMTTIPLTLTKFGKNKVKFVVMEDD